MRTVLLSGAGIVAALSLVSVASAQVGQFPEIACDAEYFTPYSCSQCFEGGSWEVGERKTDFFDTWTNVMDESQIIYEGLQDFPTIHPLSGETRIIANPEDPDAFWNFGSDLIWVESLTREGDQEFELLAGETVTLFESEPTANYTLTETDVEDGQPVAMMVFPLTHSVIMEDATESASRVHNECVVFQAEVEVAATPTPEPTPEDVTRPETGPEMLAILLAALVLAAVLVLVLRRRA